MKPAYALSEVERLLLIKQGLIQFPRPGLPLDYLAKRVVKEEPRPGQALVGRPRKTA